jgi:MFS family permease
MVRGAEHGADSDSSHRPRFLASLVGPNVGPSTKTAGFDRPTGDAMSATLRAAAPIEHAVLPLLRRVALRYLPLLFLLYVVATIDRVNVGFAKLRMQEALQFSDTIYGIGAGIFFVGYFLFEVPSNLVLARVGARKWIARILILWGPIAAATAFVQTPMQFYVLRFLLGVGEAGLFPGIVLFLTYWFPAERRTRYIALFMLGMPITGVIIGPLSAAIIGGMHGVMGLQGWQWMFIVQGMPAMLLGFVVLAWLDDKPASARWLRASEKAELQRAIGSMGKLVAPHLSPLQEIGLALKQKGIWLETAAYFFLAGTASAFGLWGPQFLQDVMKTDLKGVGAALGVIFIVGTVAMALVGRLADRSGPRETLLVTALAISAAGFLFAAFSTDRVTLCLLGFGVGVVGYLAAFPVFWGSLTPRLPAAAAAAAIALVNSIGNIGGAVGPALLGPIKQHQGLAPSVLVLGVMMALAALFALSFKKQR